MPSSQGLADGVAYERQVFHSLFATEDQKEGMAAFVAKRKAQARLQAPRPGGGRSAA